MSDLGSGITSYIGKSYYPEDDYFKGYVDNVAIYRHAQSPDEITKKSTVGGDVNSDGKCDIADAVMMQNYLLNNGTMNNWNAGDLVKDGRINIYDFLLLRKLVIS